MAADAHDNEQARSSARPWYLLVAVLVLLIAGSLVLRHIRAGSQLQARLDAIRAAGYPATCAELNDWYAIPPDANNAADLVIKAFGYYNLSQYIGNPNLPVFGPAELPARGEPLDHSTRLLIGKCLADNRQALEFLHAAAQVPHGRYPVDFSLGLNTLMPYLPDVRKGARLLALEAVWHADADRPSEAADAIIAIMGLAQSLSKEPTLMSQLVRLAIQRQAIDVLEYAASRVEFTAKRLRQLQTALRRAEDPNAMTRALVGERCFGLWCFQAPQALPLAINLLGTGSVSKPRLLLYKLLGSKDADINSYLDIMDAYIRATTLPLAERRRAAVEAEKLLINIPKTHILTRILLPAMNRVIEVEMRRIAQVRAARAALAVQRYRLARGRLPEWLSQLVGEYLDAVPTDPFDGKPLRYKKLDKGFVVYSIGEDGRDDGGKEKSPGRYEDYDVTFIVER